MRRLSPSLTPTPLLSLYTVWLPHILIIAISFYLDSNKKRKRKKASIIVNYETARFSSQTPPNHTTPVLQQLHWLPITYRIHFKILPLTFKTLHNPFIRFGSPTSFYCPPLEILFWPPAGCSYQLPSHHGGQSLQLVSFRTLSPPTSRNWKILKLYSKTKNLSFSQKL